MNRHVTLDKALMIKHILLQVETIKTKLVLSQQAKSDTIQHCPIGLVLYGISSVMTLCENQIGDINNEHVEKVCSVAVRGPKKTRESGL